MKLTKIQWCDSTVNPVAGCNGCPLFPQPSVVRKQVSAWLTGFGLDAHFANSVISGAAGEMSLSEMYHRRNDLSGTVTAVIEACKKHPLPRGFEKDLARQFSEPVSCYAGILHLMRGQNPLNPTKWIQPGYATVFERPKKFPGRMGEAAKWSDLRESDRPDAPWKNGLSRMIFVSDMGDALSGSIDFNFLREEIIAAASSEAGSRHIWLWLTKRPARMAKFDRWLEAQGIAWPRNLVPMTSVIDSKMAAGVKHLRSIRSLAKGLSVEPLLEPVSLDLDGIDWVIAGGESGAYARPFHLEWAQDLLWQSRSTGAAFFMKQLGKNPLLGGKPWPISDSHGGDWSNWPDELKLREFPALFRHMIIDGRCVDPAGLRLPPASPNMHR